MQRGREGGKFHPEHNSTNGKGVAGRRARIAKANRSRAKGGGLVWAGIKGSTSRAGSLAPPTSDNPLGFLSRAVRGALTPWRFAPGLLSAQTRHAQPSRAALTPEEALAPSSSSPLQAGDVGLTARAQKAAPRGARSPRTAVETRAQSPGYRGSGSR